MTAKQSRPRIYTAGAIRDDGDYTEWRRSVEEIDELVFITLKDFSTSTRVSHLMVLYRKI